MDAYFVTTSTFRDAPHLVHAKSCVHTPPPEGRIYVGHYRSHDAALEMARRIWPESCACVKCCSGSQETEAVLTH